MTRSTSASFRIAHLGYPSHYMAAFASCFLLSPLSPFPSRGRFPPKWEGNGISAFSREDDCIGFGSRLWSGNISFTRSHAPVHTGTLSLTVLVHAFSLSGQPHFRMLSNYGPYDDSRYVLPSRFTLAVRSVEVRTVPLRPRSFIPWITPTHVLVGSRGDESPGYFVFFFFSQSSRPPRVAHRSSTDSVIFYPSPITESPVFLCRSY